MPKCKIILFVFLLSIAAKAQESHRVSGIVVDSASKVPLISSTVTIEGTKTGTLTNQSGWFSIDISPKENLKISLVGYSTKTVKGRVIIESVSPFIIYLAEKPIVSKEVVIETESRREKTLQLMGYEQLTAAQIKYSPSFGGESDIMKTLQLLPGVTATAENSTKLNVRGGESDQNLILIDGVQAYNPMHLMNFVSSFNTDAISNVEMLKGSISSEYYGKLASVLKINLKEGNKTEHKFGGGISFLTSQLYAEGPININSSYMFSARRTYLDWILRMIHSDVGYSFNDIYGKVSYQLNQYDHLYLSGYWGLDYTSEFDDNSNKNNWGNQVLHLRYNHLWSNSVFSDFSLCYSKYFADLNWIIYKKNPYVIDYSIKNITDINISNKHTLRTGGDFHFYNFRVTSEMFSESNRENYYINAIESNLFLSSKYRLNDNLITEAGIVFSYFKENKTEESSFNVEPRLNASYLIDEDFSIKFAYILMHQYIHTLSPYNYSLPNDVFYPSSKSLPYMKGNQITIGAAKTFDFFDSNYDLSAEFYYNDMKGIPNFKNHFENADPFALSDQIIIGKGWGYGAEFQITKAEGRFSGWLNYTWNTAKRIFPDKNDDRAYDPKFHKTHQMNLALNYNVSESVKLGATYVISSGQPLTLPAQKYYIDNKPYVYYDKINGYRLPYYSRLDVSIVHFFSMWGGKWELSGSIFNLLMRKNPTFLYYDFEKGDFKKTSLGLIPTMGLKFHY